MATVRFENDIKAQHLLNFKGPYERAPVITKLLIQAFLKLSFSKVPFSLIITNPSFLTNSTLKKVK